MIINEGRIQIEGAPQELIRQRVARYALEVRETEELTLDETNGNGVRSVNRSGAHIYFADTPEQLAPLMKRYENRRMLLRPSNLEDVFLEFSGSINNDE